MNPVYFLLIGVIFLSPGTQTTEDDQIRLSSETGLMEASLAAVAGLDHCPCELNNNFDFKQSGCEIALLAAGPVHNCLQKVQYEWDFGDGTASSNEVNPIHAYARPGSYSICLTQEGVSENRKCRERICKTVEVSECLLGCEGFISPDFSIRLSECEASFISSITVNDCVVPKSVEWNFGDGSATSNTQNPRHVYSAPGTYNVCLTATGINPSGVEYQEIRCRWITVDNTCQKGCPCNVTPSFTYDITGSFTAAFTDQSIGNECTKIIAWEWDFGDGTAISTQQNPSHTYVNAGVYLVCLTIKGLNATGETCEKHICLRVEIPNDCKGCPCDVQTDFNYTKHADCLFIFGNSVLPSECSNITDMEWDFGDGSPISTDANPFHQYAEGGNYNVCFTTKAEANDGQTCQRTICKMISFSDASCGTSCQCGIEPDFTFTLDTGKCRVYFSDESLANSCSNITGWEWNIAGLIMTEQNPMLELGGSLTFPVSLTVFGQGPDGEVCSYMVDKVVSIDCNCSCTVEADFDFETSDCSATFTNKSFATNCTSIGGQYWDFGDGSDLSSEENPTHIYQNGGEYEVCLKVTGLYNDFAPCVDSLCRKIVIKDCQDCALDADIEVFNICSDDHHSGALQVEGVGGTPPYSYAINDGPFQSSGEFEHLHPEPYTIMVQDAAGCIYTEIIEIQAVEEILSGTVTIAQNPICDNSSTGIVLVAATGGMPPYEYGVNGSFSSNAMISGLTTGFHTITIRDSYGCLSGIGIEIDAASNISGTILSQTDVTCGGDQTGSLSIQGLNGTAPYEYTLGNQPSQSSGTFSGLAPGVYDVTIIDANQCTGNIQVVINDDTIDPVSAGENYIISCAGTPVQLSATPQGTYSWTPSSGLSCTDCANPMATPATTTTYTVTRTDINGCITSDQVTVQVENNLELDLGPDLSICPDESAVLNTAPVPGIYLWEPHTGLSCYDCPSPQIQVAQTTTYQVTVVNGNCISQDEITVHTNELAAADFTYQLVDGLEVQFSASPNGFTAYHWNFGDPATGNNNTGQGVQANHTFSMANHVYNVCLTVENSCGPFTICHPIFIDYDCVEGRTTLPDPR